MTVLEETPLGRKAQRTPRRGARARRRLLLLALAPLAAGALAAGISMGRHDSAAAAHGLEVAVAGRTLVRIPEADRSRAALMVRRRLPTTARVQEGTATVTYQLDRDAAARAAARASSDWRGVVALPKVAIESEVATPVVAQKLRNNCEAAALQAVLATRGRRADQLSLQRELPRSGPADPSGSGASKVWGDPDRGFVGRPDGGGIAGGFGVYPGPVRDVAGRHGVNLRDLTGRSPGQVYDALLRGRAVMAWVGLGDGPFEQWQSPEGRPIKVNLNEHTVVLTGVRRDGALRVMNPLEGTREIWTRAEFETMWARLGRRALST